jgi:hypothetical protein
VDTWRHLQDLAAADERVKIMRGDRNDGFIGSSKAKACGQARGALLVELDHDDKLTPNCLQLPCICLLRGQETWRAWRGAPPSPSHDVAPPPPPGTMVVVVVVVAAARGAAAADMGASGGRSAARTPPPCVCVCVRGGLCV